MRTSGGAGTRPTKAHGTPLEAAGAMGSDHSFTLQAVMALQESTGGLKSAVDSLSKQADQHRAEIDKRLDQQHKEIRWMARVLWMAAGALAVLSPIVVWLINHRFDEILNALAKGGG